MIKLGKVASKILKPCHRTFSTPDSSKLTGKSAMNSLNTTDFQQNAVEFNNFIARKCDHEGKSLLLNQHINNCLIDKSDLFIGDYFQGEEGRTKFINCIQDLAYITNNKLTPKEKNDFVKNLSYITEKLNVGIRSYLLKADFYEDLLKKKLIKLIEGSPKENELRQFINHVKIKHREFGIILKVLLDYELNDSEWDYIYNKNPDKAPPEAAKNNVPESDVVMNDSINEVMDKNDKDTILLEKDDEFDLYMDNQLNQIGSTRTPTQQAAPLYQEYSIDEELARITDKDSNMLEIDNFQDYREETTLTHSFEYKQTNWVYVMDLPYDFNEEKYTKILKQRFKPFGSVKQVIFQKYCNHVARFEENKVIFHDISDASESQKFIDENTNNSMRSTQKGSNLQSVNKLDNESSLSVLNKNTGTKIFNKMDKEKIKYRKSYALVEMETYEQKMKLITPHTRVFGIYLEDKCSKLEDADYKSQLVLSNLPYGYKMKKVIEKVNSILKSHKIEEFQINEVEGNKVIVNNTIVLGFDNYSNALIAFDKLKGVMLFGRYIKVNFIYGNLKEVDGHYIDERKINFKRSIAKSLTEINKLEKNAILHNEKFNKPNQVDIEAVDDILFDTMQDFSNNVVIDTFDSFDLQETIKGFDKYKEEMTQNSLIFNSLKN